MPVACYRSPVKGCLNSEAETTWATCGSHPGVAYDLAQLHFWFSADTCQQHDAELDLTKLGSTGTAALHQIGAQSTQASPVSPTQTRGGCASNPRWLKIVSITSRFRMAAMIFNSPAPQFGQCCMSVSKAQTSAKTSLYSVCKLMGNSTAQAIAVGVGGFAAGIASRAGAPHIRANQGCPVGL